MKRRDQWYPAGYRIRGGSLYPPGTRDA